MTDQADLAKRVMGAVEELTEKGSVGFYASAIVDLTGDDPNKVTRQLLTMVKQNTLEPRFEVRCPDNGRRINSYSTVNEIPLGEEVSSDRCDAASSFTLDETDVYIRFRLNQDSSSALRRRRHQEEGESSGKAHQIRVHPGASPRTRLPQILALNRQ